MVANASHPSNDANQSAPVEPTAFFASEGVYQVTKHFFIEQAVPNLAIGTRITLVTIKSRDSTTHHQNTVLDHLGKTRTPTTATTAATATATAATTTSQSHSHSFGQDGSAIVSEAASSATSSTIRTDEEDGGGGQQQQQQNGAGKGDAGSESDQSVVTPTSTTSGPPTSSQSVSSRLAAAAVMIPRVGPLRRADTMQAQSNNSNQSVLNDTPSPQTSTPTLVTSVSATETGATIGSSASSNSLAAIFSSGGSGRRSKPKNDVNRTTSSFLMRSSPQEMMNPLVNMNAQTLGTAANNATNASATMSTRFASAISSTPNGLQDEQRNGRASHKSSNGDGASHKSSNSDNGCTQVPGIQKDTFIFFNVGRTFYWSGLDAKDLPVSYINFSKAFPTCHDVNMLTRDSKHLDVIIGFSTGDIIWFDPICNRYHRLNKQGVVNGSAVTAIQWIPGSDQLFMVAFKDGCMAIFDRDKDDQPVSLQSSHRNTKFHVTRAPKGSKHNPTSYWQVSPRAVTAFAISPDCQHMAMTSMDGCLRIVDLIQEKLIHTFESYFGGLTCVAWSPDGKYIITGGQDDLVSIWSFIDHCIVARCQGHQSWVTDVAFDNWRCDEDQYRFGSVGEDGQILLWDFSVQTLGKPKRRNSVTTSGIHSRRHTRTESSMSNQPIATTATTATTTSSTNNQHNKTKDAPPLHHALPRSQVPILRPIAGMVAHEDPTSSIIFQEKYLLTTCCRGHIKLWSRPFTTNAVSSVVSNVHLPAKS